MFRERLEQEFAERRAKNARYSLRAFAAFLGTDYAPVSQVLRGSRKAPAARIREWAKRLGMTAEEAAVCIAAAHVPDAGTAHRQHQLRPWTAEALGIVSDRAHWEIVRYAGDRAAGEAHCGSSECRDAKVLIPPTVLPEGDEMAVLHDPQGMFFAVLRWNANAGPRVS